MKGNILLSVTGHVVTVVAEKESFVRKTLKSMIDQSGRTEKDWVDALSRI